MLQRHLKRSWPKTANYTSELPATKRRPNRSPLSRNRGRGRLTEPRQWEGASARSAPNIKVTSKPPLPAHALENLVLHRKHFAPRAAVAVIVAQQMQRAVNAQERDFGAQIVLQLLRLMRGGFERNHQIAQRDVLFICGNWHSRREKIGVFPEGKRQHIGRFVFAPKARVRSAPNSGGASAKVALSAARAAPFKARTLKLTANDPKARRAEGFQRHEI